MPRQTDIILRGVFGNTLEAAALRMVLVLAAVALVLAAMAWLVLR